MKILVAENDSITRDMICVPLRTSADVEVIETANGQQARALFDKNLFVAVVIDWQLPGMTGLDFTRSIRLAGSHVPILMVSARASRRDVIKAIRAGISDYLLRPFDSNVLWRKVNRMLGRPAEMELPAAS